MAECGYMYTDPKNGRMYTFTTSDEMLDFIRQQKTSQNITEFTESLDKLKDKELIKAFEDVKILLSSSYRIEWFSKLRSQFPELKESSSRLYALNSQELEDKLKQAQSIAAFVQSGMDVSKAIREDYDIQVLNYTSDPETIFNYLNRSNQFAEAYLGIINPLRNYFIANNITSNNPVMIALNELQENLIYIQEHFKKLAVDNAANALWEVFKDSEIAGNHIDIQKQLKVLEEQITDELAKGNTEQVEVLQNLYNELQMSHPEIEARRQRLKAQYAKAVIEGKTEFAKKLEEQLNKISNKKITKELIKKTLVGDVKDINWLTAYLEAAGMSGDVVISGLDKILKRNQRIIRKQTQILQNELADIQSKFLTLTGGNKNNLKNSYKDLYQWVDLLSYDDDGNEVNTRRLAFMTEFNWEFLNEHNRLKQEYKTEYSKAVESGDFTIANEAFKKLSKWRRDNLEMEGNSKYYEMLDGLPVEAREVLDEVNFEIKLFETTHKNQLQISAEEFLFYKQLQLKKSLLYSEYDNLTGEKKTGKDLRIAEALQRYRETIKDLYEYEEDLQGQARWSKNLETFTKLIQSRLKDGIIDTTEFNRQMSMWHQLNSTSVYDEKFIEERSKLLEALKEVLGESNVNTLREELNRLKGGYTAKDDQNRIIGLLFQEPQQIKIKSLESRIELNNKLNNEITEEEYNKFFEILTENNLISVPLEELITDKYRTLIGENIGVVEKVIKAFGNRTKNGSEDLFKIFEALDTIQENIKTEYYNLKYQEEYEKFSLNNLKLDSETDVQYQDRIDNYVRKSTWFKNNHYIKLTYDKDLKKYYPEFVPISIWTSTEPRDKTLIKNTPGYKYSNKRVISEKYRNKNVKFDKVLNSFLPKEGKYRNESYPSNPEVQKILKELTNIYINRQENLAQPNKLGYFYGGKEQDFSEIVLNSDEFKKKAKRAGNYIQNRFKIAVSDKDNGYGLADLQGEPFKYVPIKYTYTLEEADQSYDVFSMIMGYLYDLEQSKVMENSLPTFESVVKILEENTPVSTQKNILASTLGIDRFTNGKTNNRAKQAKSMLMAQMYKEYKNPAENRLLSKLVDNMNGFGAFTMLFFNAPSQAVNWMSARVQTTIEGISNEFFNYNIWKAGELEYAKRSRDFMTDFMKSGNKSFISQLVDLFDPLNGEYTEAVEDGFKKSALRELISGSPGSYLRNLGEHEVQISAFLGILKSKIVLYEGKEMNLLQAYETHFNKHKNFNLYEADVYNTIVEENKITKYDKYTDTTELNLMSRIQGINIQLHGNYAKLNQTMAERYTLGRVIFFFRKYFVPMAARRFASFRSNSMTDSYTEGFYITAFNKIIKELYDIAIGNKQFKNLKNWKNELTPLETANLKRFAMETTVILGLILFGYILTQLAGDEDDEGNVKLTKDSNFFALYAVYLAKRVRSESEQFFPILGFEEMGKTILTPSVSGKGHLRNYKQFTSHLIDTVNGDEKAYYDQDSGFWDKGDSKIVADIIRITTGLTGKTFEPYELIKGFDFSQRQL